jgi:hypothetical protein
MGGNRCRKSKERKDAHACFFGRLVHKRDRAPHPPAPSPGGEGEQVNRKRMCSGVLPAAHSLSGVSDAMWIAVAGLCGEIASVGQNGLPRNDVAVEKWIWCGESATPYPFLDRHPEQRGRALHAGDSCRQHLPLERHQGSTTVALDAASSRRFISSGLALGTAPRIYDAGRLMRPRFRTSSSGPGRGRRGRWQAAPRTSRA